MSAYKQFIKLILAQNIQHVEALQKEGRSLEKNFYSLAEPETEEGRAAFATLNMVRKKLKQVDRRLHSLRQAQKLMKNVPDVLLATEDDQMFVEYFEKNSVPITFDQFEQMVADLGNGKIVPIADET